MADREKTIRIEILSRLTPAERKRVHRTLDRWWLRDGVDGELWRGVVTLTIGAHNDADRWARQLMNEANCMFPYQVGPTRSPDLNDCEG